MTDSHENRMTEMLRNYWESLRDDRPFPQENQIDPDKLESIWGRCFLAEIKNTENGRVFKYEYLGGDLIEALGIEEADRLVKLSDHKVAHKFQEVIDGKKPVIDEAEFINGRNMRIKYRQLLLPVGKGDDVGYIFGGMNWRAY